MMYEEMLQSKLKDVSDVYRDIFNEAIVPLRVDYSAMHNSFGFNDFFTNNVSISFTYHGHTIYRSLEELCRAAMIPFKPIYYTAGNISEEKRLEIREELRVSMLHHADQLCRHRDISEPWCMEICSQLLKFVVSE